MSSRQIFRKKEQVIAEVQTPNPDHQMGSHLNWVDLDCQAIP